MDFNFRFALDVRALTQPAGQGAEALQKLARALGGAKTALDRFEGAAGGISSKIQKMERATAAASVGIEKIAASAASAVRARQREESNYSRWWERELSKQEKSTERAAAAKLRAEERAAATQARLLDREGSKAAAAAARAVRTRERQEASYSRFWERELTKQEKASARTEAAKVKAAERESRRWAKEWETTFAKVGKLAEKAQHKPWFGGEKSLGGLFRGRLDNKVSGMATGATDWLLGLPGMALGAGKSAVLGGVAASGAGAAYIGKQIFDSAKFRENSQRRFSAILGSDAAARDEVRYGFKTAEKTEFDPSIVLGGSAQLANNYKNATQRREILGSILDFASVTGSGNEGLESAVRAVSQIASKGKLQQEELTGQLGEMGLNTGEVYKRLAPMLGIKGGTEAQQRTNVIAAITGGKVTGEQGVSAITATMRAMAGGGPAGSYAEKSSDTITGQVSNIQSGFSTLFGLADVSQWDAVKNVKAGLGGVATIFSSESEAGQGLIKVIEGMTESFNPLIKEITADIDSFSKMLAGSSGGVSLFADGIAGVAHLLYEAAKVVGIVTYAIVGLGGIIYRVISTSMEFISQWDGAIDTIKEKLGLGGSDDAAEGSGQRPAGSKYFAGNLNTGEYDANPAPSYASGGVVPGKYGEETVIRAHGGEVVSGLRGEFMNRMGGARPAAQSAGQSIVLNGGVHFHIDGSGKNGEQVSEEACMHFMRWIGQQVRSPGAGSLPGGGR